MNLASQTHRSYASYRNCKGLTLIEVVVALVILSIGILGLTSLQTASLNFSTVANQTSQATVLAYDMADRMRANRAAVQAGAYDIAFQSPTPACAAPATVGTIAQQDISAWRMALACRLPQATGSIARNGATVILTVQWDDSHGTATPLNFQFTTAL